MAEKKSSNRKLRKISPARISAFEILRKIETEKAFSSYLLPFYEEKLSDRDSALCHELTLGILRNKIYLDKIIERLTKLKKLDKEVLIALRIGLYQILFLEKIPPHAAINDAVNLVKRAKKTSAGGLVNAVLRQATREKIDLNFKDDLERISVETSHPRWLVEKWIDEFGFEVTEKLTRANNKVPEQNFRLTAKTTNTTKNLLKILDLKKDSAVLRKLAENGEIYFQDEGSQIVARAIELKEDQSFLDVCAAPGSKTTLVAVENIAEHRQNFLAAGDFYWRRVQNLKENCENQGLNGIQIVQYDAEKTLPFRENSFDWVLVDAPCTGTGTIRHNPEIRYFLQPGDILELSAKQLKILINASKLTKSGGKLVYSTCSLEIEENEKVCQSFLAGNRNFHLVKPRVADNYLTEKGFARTFPQKDKMDGFFIAVFEKK